MDDHLRDCIRREGERFAKRAAWLRTMIERQQGVILNCQKTLDGFLDHLQVVETALDGLRKEYRQNVGQENETFSKERSDGEKEDSG